MKKNYMKLMALVAVFCTIAFEAVAQPLSGAYTINSGNATTYPSGTNFQTFNAFATALNTNGVNGPVNVSVIGGPFNEQVIFNQIPGLNSANKVTIDGNNCLITFNSSSSSAPHTIGLNGTDWFHIKNLNVQGTGATYAFPLILYSGADYNYFTNCTFSCNANQGTGTTQIPIVISGIGTSYSGASNSGNYNTFMECATFGGYFAHSLYGTTTIGQYGQGNSFINTAFRDFYQYGTYCYYHENVTIKGCLYERPTRTNHSTVYAMMVQVASGCLIEGNTISRLYNLNQTYTGTIYGYYIAGQTSTTYNSAGNTVRNNIFTDVKSNGSIYGYYIFYINGDLVNNTFSVDNPASTSTGQILGFYMTTTTNRPINAANNLIYIDQGGSGAKYGIYYATTSLITSNRNNVWFGPSGTNKYYGFSGSAQTTLANLQTATGQEANSLNMDPVFVNASTNVEPTSIPFNNLATPLGLVFDQKMRIRNQVSPDIGAIEFLTPACSGTPPSNTVTVPNYSICPGEDVSLGLAYLDPNLGYTYQWQSSTVSNVGPWNTISGANTLFYTAPSVTANTYYSVVMTCTAPGGTSIQPVGQVMVSGPTFSTVPAYESFEQVGKPNRLPNCSWSASGMGSQNRTSPSSMSGNRIARNGTSFGYFDNANPGTSYFYSNPIALSTGITYSAAVWYATEYFGYSNWSNLSIMIGPNQSTVGMVQVATVGPAISGPYKLLDGTFTVNNAGNYYVAIKATGSSGNAQYLMIDDLSITIPCQPGSPNTSTVAVSASQNTICLGQQISVTAVGADTYTWNTGDQTNVVTNLAPTQNTVYIVQGQNAITGCISLQSVSVTVLPLPTLMVLADHPAVCPGEQVILTVHGATNVIWNPSSSVAQNLIINPNSTTSYTVTGTDPNGCSTDYVTTVTVFPAPTVSATSSNPDACKDDALTLQAHGNGLTFQWNSNTSPVMYQGNPITVQALTSTIFTVVTVGAHNCTNFATVVQNISECTGLSKNGTSLNGLAVYPNPTSGAFSVVLHSNADKTVKVTDVTGRVILTTTSNEEVINLNLSDLSAGVYYVSVKSENSTEVLKIVKN